MHIPDSMLQGNLCPVTAAASAVGIIAAAWWGARSADKPTAGRFGAVTALIFAGQMMNFPIMHGTSGHLLGGVLAASLLGVPFGILAVALVVAIQSLVFSDGGMTVLGANVFNMALLGAGAGGLARAWLAAKLPGLRGARLATMLAAWASVVLAALAVSVELALDGQAALGLVLPAMLGAHALIGLGEAAITAAVCAAFAAVPAAGSARGRALAPLTAAAVTALLFSPFASGLPDGLEWVAAKYDFLHASAPAFVGPLADYAVPGLSSVHLATGLAGLLGVSLTFGAAWLVQRILALRAASAA